MIRLTDGQKTISVEMKIRISDFEYGRDFSHEFFNVDNLRCDEKTGVYVVPDIQYCIDQVEDWMNAREKFHGDEIADPNDRYASWGYINTRKYELRKASSEIPYTKKKDIRPGCAVVGTAELVEPEIIGSFCTLDSALDALKKYKSSVELTQGYASKFYTVTEYYVEENHYDEDGEWFGGGDIWAYADMTIDEN